VLSLINCEWKPIPVIEIEVEVVVNAQRLIRVEIEEVVDVEQRGVSTKGKLVRAMCPAKRVMQFSERGIPANPQTLNCEGRRRSARQDPVKLEVGHQPAAQFLQRTHAGEIGPR